MRATKFEFQYRLWIIFAIYFAGFVFFRWDISAITALHRLLGSGPAVPPNFARGVIAVGAACVFVAAALRTWASAYLRSDIVHDTAEHSDALVADGPFRFTRNPLYLANLPMAVGIGLLASRSGLLFILIANWIFVYRLIGREEEALQNSIGESYRKYCAAVPRFWPALTPRVRASGEKSRWRQAFLGESFIWFFGIAPAAIAVTLKAKVGIAIFIAGFVLHMITNRLLRQGRTSAARNG